MNQSVGSRWARIRSFLGTRVIWIFTLGIVLGMLGFGVELTFGFLLQAFLYAAGALKDTGFYLPHWCPPATLRWILPALIGIGLVRCYVIWAQGYYGSKVYEEFTYLHRKRALVWAYFNDSANSGEISLLFTHNCTLAGGALMSLQTLLISTTTAVLLLANLIWIAPRSTLIALVGLAVLILPVRKLDRDIRSRSEGIQVELEKTFSRLMVSIKNLVLIHIYGTQKTEADFVGRGLTFYLNESLKNLRGLYLKSVLPQFLGIVIICVLTLSAHYLNELSSALLVAYLYLFVRFVQTVAMAMQNVSNIHMNLPSLRKVFGWWSDEAAPRWDGLIAKAEIKSYVELPGTEQIGWKVENLSFRYPGGGVDVVSKLNIDITPGSVFVVLGESGSGKSTLLNLLLGGLVPQSGSIDILHSGSSRSLREVRKSLLDRTGYVGSESFLIEGTIQENLTYGLKTMPSEDDLATTLRQAECGFIFELKEGLQHRITEQGQGLSSGQKQRLALARALLRKPLVLVLDEATSNLDTDTEEKLIRLFDSFKRSMTIIAVTHRQGLVRIADQVLRMGR